MKVEIKVEDISLFAKALNNACISYNDIIWSIYMGCEVPSKFDLLEKLPEEELKARIDCIKNVYRQVEEIEKSKSKGNV